jgi:hypothetical protein
LQGCVIVMSGIVPLGADLMRQVDDIYELKYSQLLDIYGDYWGVREGHQRLTKFRSEIAQQTETFGAKIRKK